MEICQAIFSRGDHDLLLNQAHQYLARLFCAQLPYLGSRILDHPSAGSNKTKSAFSNDVISKDFGFKPSFLLTGLRPYARNHSPFSYNIPSCYGGCVRIELVLLGSPKEKRIIWMGRLE